MQELDVQRVDTLEGLEDLEREWKELASHVCDLPYALTWEYCYLRWKHFADNRTLWILTARNTAGELVGVAPWTVSRSSLGPFVIRRLEFVTRADNPGTIEPFDGEDLDVIAQPEYRDTVAWQFLQHLNRSRSQWDVLDFGWLSPDSTLGTHLRHARTWKLELTAPSFVSTLPSDLTTYEASTLGKSETKRIHRHARRLERDFADEISYRRVSDPAEVEPAIMALVDMNKRRWSSVGEPTAFQDIRHIRFHVDLARLSFQRGWLRLHQLRVGDDVIASNCCIAPRATYHLFHKGFDPDWSRYGPGNVLQLYEIGQAIEEGSQYYDWGHGTEEAKVSWSDIRRDDRRVIVGQGWKGFFYVGRAWGLNNGKALARRMLSGPTYQKLRQRLLGRFR